MQSSEPSAADLLALVLQRRRFILRTGFLVALVTGLIIFVLPRTYTVEVSALPISAGLPGGRVAGLAAQFGLSALGTPAGQSPDFYAAYLQSREIRLRALDEPVAFVPPPRSRGAAADGAQSLIDVLGVPMDDSLQARELAVEELADMVSVSVDRLAGTVHVRVRTRWPEFARELADIYLKLLVDFNTELRQSQAVAERTFVERRLADAQAELQQAERKLQSFLEGNRTWQSSPSLVVEHDRIRRFVDLRQSIVSSLAQSYEQARIDEVRDTPLLVLVQQASLPGMPDRRGLVVKVVGAGIFGCFAGIVLAIAIDLLRAASGNVSRRPSSAELIAQAGRDLRAPWRLLF